MKNRRLMAQLTTKERGISAKMGELRTKQRYHREQWILLDVALNVLRQQMVESFKKRGKDYGAHEEMQRKRVARQMRTRRENGHKTRIVRVCDDLCR